MPSRIEGYRCKQLRCFRPIFEEWIKSVRAITKKWHPIGDVPWWYNERASLSTFAGAIWRAGGHCFEEYSDEKRKVGKRTRRLGRHYSGRVDLYFNWARYDFIAEAKEVWSGYSQRNGHPERRLEKFLQFAADDVKKTRAHGQRRLGLLFATPYFRRSARENIDERLSLWVESLAEVRSNAYAWVFPRKSRRIRAADGTYCPGVAVLIKEL